MKDSKQTQTPIEDLAELRNYFSSHNVVREYIAHSSKVHSVGWSCDGKRLASGSFDKSVVIFSLERNRLVSILIIYFKVMLILSVSPLPYKAVLLRVMKYINYSICFTMDLRIAQESGFVFLGAK